MKDSLAVLWGLKRFPETAFFDEVANPLLTSAISPSLFPCFPESYLICNAKLVGYLPSASRIINARCIKQNNFDGRGLWNFLSSFHPRQQLARHTTNNKKQDCCETEWEWFYHSLSTAMR